MRRFHADATLTTASFPDMRIAFRPLFAKIDF
jgi:hypothetical protein